MVAGSNHREARTEPAPITAASVRMRDREGTRRRTKGDADMEVLVATDGSEAAIDAARRSLALLRADARLVLVSVIHDREDPMETAGGFEGPGISEHDAEVQFAADQEGGRAALERTSAALQDDAVEVQLVPVDVEPGRAIVELALDRRPDLIVIGAGGKGFVKRLFTGSVSDYVVHHAPCPVLVVRHDH
jgi:nucleotide-binding universal stress UspA family protein